MTVEGEWFESTWQTEYPELIIVIYLYRKYSMCPQIALRFKMWKNLELHLDCGSVSDKYKKSLITEFIDLTISLIIENIN